MKTMCAGLILPAMLPLAAIAAPVAPAAPDLAPRGEIEATISMPGEAIVCLERDDRLDPAILAALVGDDDRVSTRVLMQWTRRGAERTTLILHLRGLPAGTTPAAAATRVAALGDLIWATPNEAIVGDPRELVPNDPDYGSQYHHPLMQNDDAWDLTLGDASVLIAITDDGVDLDHPDLAPNVWTNPGEIAGDGVDNDFNGYADDVQGWDVINGNNDPNPEGTNEHGTHVAGIAAARTDNGIGVSGTAGLATIMPVQFYTAGQAWPASVVAEAFVYATDNGARIISTSYNINGWVGNPAVTAAFDYLYDAGVLHFNSAGNGNDLNPPRQLFHQSLLVANTDAGDVRSSSSNHGTGVDLAAPGSNILSTELNGTYGLKSGTSMSAPNAAGVAALVWSLNPTWTRDQVAAQVVGTTDSIDAQNPAYVGLLGSGRVNAFRALTETLSAPGLGEVLGLPAEGSLVTGSLGTVTVRFEQIMSPASVNSPGAFRLEWAGPDGSFDTADDAAVPLDVDEYLIAANEATMIPAAALPGAGSYRFVIDGSRLRSPFNLQLDADGSGSGGGTFLRSFEACAVIIVSTDPLESGIGWSVENTDIADGAWDAAPAVPVGGGDRSDPATDFDGSGRCFLTDNVDDNSDVDGGPTRLISYAIDVSALPDPYLGYARWLGVNGGSDAFTVEVSGDDGATWELVESVTGNRGWEEHTFRVADHVTPSSTVRLRFSVSDNPNDTVVEGAVDALKILEIDCTPPSLPADVDGDGVVGLGDLIAVLAAWGPCDAPPCPADVDGSGTIDLADLLAVLAAWG